MRRSFTLVLLGTLLAAPVSQSIAACVAPPAGLAGWFRAENTTIDAVTGNVATLGTAGYAAGEVGQAFDLQNGGIVVPSHAAYNPTASGLTVELWMKGIHNQPASLYMLAERSHGATNRGWAFQGDATTGKVDFLLGTGSGYVGVASTADLLDDVFHHLAGTWDGATMRFYVDGALQGSTAVASVATDGAVVAVGYWNNGGANARRFLGRLDELSFYGRALSQAEIQNVYNAGADGKCTPCGNGTLDPDESCDDGNLVSGDCCSAACVGEAAGNACADDGVSCTQDVCSGGGTCIHPSDGSCPCTPVPSGIVSWWRGRGNALDTTDGNSGTLQAPGTYAAAIAGQGFDLNPGGWVVVNHNANLNPTAPGFTAAFWMKGIHNQTGTLFAMLDKSHSGSDNQGWVFQGTSSSGKVSFTMGTPAGFVSAEAPRDLLDGAFHHVAGIWDGSTITLYVDGAAHVSRSVTATNNNNRQFLIGNWYIGGRQFKGVLDEVTIFNRALTATEVRTIFSAGAAGQCSLCGNGSIQTDEQCDDGTPGDGDCCTAGCLFETAGAGCTDDGNVCTDDTCDGTGTCLHPANTAPCDDGTFCNGDDTCAGTTCSVHAGDPCPGADGDADCMESCDESGEVCTANDPDGAVCTGGTCGGGLCVTTSTSTSSSSSSSSSTSSSTSTSSTTLPPYTSIGVLPSKLIVVDKTVLASSAKLVFVAKDPSIDKGPGTDVEAIDVEFTARYGNGLANGGFVLPAGSANGWLVNKSTVAKFVNRDAPAGATQAKVAVIKPGSLAKLVGRGLGDTPFDILGAGDPAGFVHTAFCVTNDGVATCHCSTLDACAWKAIGAGTGAKLACRGGVADPACMALSP